MEAQRERGRRKGGKEGWGEDEVKRNERVFDFISQKNRTLRFKGTLFGDKMRESESFHRNCSYFSSN